MEWHEYWNNYQDLKYPLTILICLALGFVAGYSECKSRMEKKCREEAVRLAITNTIK